jgi:hypothetical protein
VPSYEFERIHGESNLNTWRDGVRVLRALIVERSNRRGRAPQAQVVPVRPQLATAETPVRTA